MNLAVAGGGTGGHIFAGVAIAQEFKSQSRANDVLFVGSEYGLETRLVPKAGFRLETLKLGKLVGQNFLRKILTLLQIPFAVLKCVRILRRNEIDLVIGVGGYAAGPCILAARLLRIPTGVLEQNAVMGFTNRLSARLAGHVFTAFDEIPAGLPAAKCTFTGNPVRVGLRPEASKQARLNSPPMDGAQSDQARPFTVFAFGGSQGASGINRMMVEAAREFVGEKNTVRIIHQTGEREFDQVVAAYREMGFPAEVHRFIDDMQSMYDRASLVVCRAGSGTIAELGATKNAALFIPFPFAAQDHQARNAELIERAGAGVMIPQFRKDRDGARADTPGTELAARIRALRDDLATLARMRENIAAFSRPDAAHRIVELMKIHALKRRPA